jgi:serine/threonine protein phosphatase PrpC
MGAMNTPCVDWGVASAALSGESVSGDRGVAHIGAGGVLIAVVDGAGHGPEAARASELATEILQRTMDQSVDEQIRECHRGLAGTRGVVLLAVRFDEADATLSWAGVGDVLGVLVRADHRTRPSREILFPREGIVGRSLPQLSRSLLAVHDGDMLVLATDGIRDGFVEHARSGENPRRVAARVLELDAKGTDDALVLAASFRVGPR